ncbi:MAG: response regulator [Candidatus Magnetomorum sp.]|nr:response regulator [Candidatus Magnetomorum sp.]
MAKDKKRTILCVDDELDILESLSDTLMDHYRVLTTISVKEAIEIFDKNDVSLVISDQRMPEMEGSKFLAIINEKKPICKKILLTGFSDLDAAIEAINKGNIDKYFSKPWDSDELLTAIEHLLSTYSVDELFSRMMKDGKGMKDAMKRESAKNDQLIEFLNYFQKPVCIVNDDMTVSFVNQKALDVLNYSDINDVLGNDFVDHFVQNMGKSTFEENYVKKGVSPEKLSLKTSDGSTVDFPSTLVLTPGETGNQLRGIIWGTFS